MNPGPTATIGGRYERSPDHLESEKVWSNPRARGGAPPISFRVCADARASRGAAPAQGIHPLILRRREELQQDTSPRIGSTGEVLQLAREALPELKEEDRVDLDELIQANSPPPRGRDPMVKSNTDKALFFSRHLWCEAWPRDFKVYKGGAA